MIFLHFCLIRSACQRNPCTLPQQQSQQQKLIKSLKSCEEDVLVSQISKGFNTLVWLLVPVKALGRLVQTALC